MEATRGASVNGKSNAYTHFLNDCLSNNGPIGNAPIGPLTRLSSQLVGLVV